jgi:hypothetical protein
MSGQRSGPLVWFSLDLLVPAVPLQMDLLGGPNALAGPHPGFLLVGTPTKIGHLRQETC